MYLQGKRHPRSTCPGTTRPDRNRFIRVRVLLDILLFADLTALKSASHPAGMVGIFVTRSHKIPKELHSTFSRNAGSPLAELSFLIKTAVIENDRDSTEGSPVGTSIE